MRWSQPSALRFALVATALTLGVVGQALVDGGHLRWAVTPYFVAVAAFALANLHDRSSSSLAAGAGDTVSQYVSSALVPGSLRNWTKDPEQTLALGAFALALLLLGVALWGFGVGPPNTVAWYAYGVSALLLLLALPGLERGWTGLVRRARQGRRISVGFSSIWPWAVLGLILVLALFIRLYQLDELPAGLWYDEADNLFFAREIQRAPGNTLVFVPSTNLPSLFLLPIAAVIEITGVTVTTGRLVSVGFGVVGVVAVFLLVRLMLGPSMALVAAFLMAVMRWDINWSRIGMHGITAPLFAALTAYLTLRAMRSGRMSDYGYSGAALGLGMWFYTAHRLFPLVVAFMLLHHLLLQRPPLRRFAAQLLVMALVALAVAAPVVQVAITDPGEFFQRTKTSSVFSHASTGDAFGRMATSLHKHVLMFNHEGDPNPRHNLPNEPMLDFLSGVLLVLGLAIAAIRWRNVAFAILPIWVLIMVMPGVLTLHWEAPQSLRSIGTLPAVIALITIAIWTLWRAGRSAPWSRARRATPLVFALLLGVIAYSNVSTYFGRQAEHPEVYAAFSTDETLMARHMVEQQRVGRSLLVSRQFLYSVNTTLLADRPQTRVLRAPSGVPIPPSHVWQGVSIYLEPREASVYRLLKAYYPDGSFQEIRPPGGGKVLYYSAVITEDQLDLRRGLRAEYTDRSGTIILKTQRTGERAWPLGSGPELAPFELAWSGALHVSEAGRYVLALDGDVSAEVVLDGMRILWDRKRSVRIEPAVGLHSLEITGRVNESGSVLRLLWQPPGGKLQTIPRGNLYHGSVRPVGLAGRFTLAGLSEGVAATEVTPAMEIFYYDPVVPEPYVAVWEGFLDVPEQGRYGFEVGGAGEVTLVLDGIIRAQSPGSGTGEAVTGVLLDGGDHPIRVEYRSDAPPSEFEVLWAPPGQPLGPIPVELLSPAPEHMFRIAGVGD